MKLGVIVVNYNGYEDTIKYVNTIKEYSSVDKVIVVDNCSTNDSFKRMKVLDGEKVDVILSDKNGGYSYGNNFGIKYLIKKYGDCKYICISNSDVKIKENAFIRCIDFLDNNEDFAIAAPRMYDINNNPHPLSGWMLRNVTGDVKDSSLLLTKYNKFPHCEQYDVNWMKQKEIVVDCVAGSFFIIRNDIFKKIGYFDENLFLFFEEDVIGNKLKKLGYKCIVLNDVKFIHMESVTINKALSDIKKFRQMQKSKRYYHKTYNNAGPIKLFALDFVTFFRHIENPIFRFKQKCKNDISHNLILLLIYKNFNWIKLQILSLLKWFIKSFVGLFVLLFSTLLFIIMLPVSLVQSLFNRKKILYYSIVTWKWIKQRPHYIASCLADAGFDVTYTSQNLFPKYRDQSLPHTENLNTNQKLKITDFNILPERGIYTYINHVIRFVRYCTYNYGKIILTHPNQYGSLLHYIMKFRRTEIYYECMDNYIGWENDKALYELKERRLIEASKHVFVSADGLKQQLIKKYNVDSNKITVVRNGYDSDLFANYKKVKTNLPKNSVTYIGTIDEWFDFDKICKYAKKHPKINFEIIGPVGVKAKEKVANIKEKNIHFLGVIEHDLVPQYIIDSDVLIVPFILNDIIKFVDPVKVYEYLYFKKNVLTSYWDELKQFDGLVYFYKNYDEFESQLDKALNSKFKSNSSYDKLMNDAKWENRLIIYEEEFKKKIKKNPFKIIICLLVLILFLQIGFLYKKSSAKNIINPTKSYSYVEQNSLVFSMTNEIVKKEINNSTIALYIDSLSGLNTGLLYYFSSYDLYPNKLYNLASDMDLTEQDEKINEFKKQVENNNIDYIYCFSSCKWFSDLYNINMSDDEYSFLIAANDNGKMNILYNDKFDIVNYYKIYKNLGMLDTFDQYVKYLNNNYNEYNDGYSYELINKLNSYLESIGE